MHLILGEVVDTIPTIYLTPVLVTVIISVFIPIVTGLITKYTLHPTWKNIITIILNAISALVVGATMLPTGVSVISSQALLSAIIGVVVSIATYLGIWVPAKVTNRPDGILGAQTGIGPKVHRQAA